MPSRGSASVLALVLPSSGVRMPCNSCPTRAVPAALPSTGVLPGMHKGWVNGPVILHAQGRLTGAEGSIGLAVANDLTMACCRAVAER